MQHDGREWEVVRVNLPTRASSPGKYLVDPATREVAYLVDPGIGGRIREIDGRPITKLDSPKATIMALVTDGILTQKLPWGLVLIGVFLTFAIELMGLQSLPIAVGRVSADLHLGGDVRRRRGALAGGAADARRRAVHRRGGVGAGRAFSSGLIAGGALAGVAIAGIAAALVRQGRRGAGAGGGLSRPHGRRAAALGGVRPERPGGAGRVRLPGAALYRVACR